MSQEDTTHSEIQINLILEPLPSPNHPQPHTVSTVRMIGFVMINDIDMKLSNLRLTITQQLDDQQLETIGINFKFMKANFPVSTKQETSIKISTISIITPLANHPYTHKNGLIVPNCHEHELKSDTIHPKKDNTATQPINHAPCIATNKPQQPLEYTVMIRACHKVFTPTVCKPNNIELRSSLKEEPQKIIIPPLPKHNDAKRTTQTNPNPKPSDLNSVVLNAALTRKSLEGMAATATASFICSYPLSGSPKSTRLETQIGEKLPRIGPQLNLSSDQMGVTKEVDSILKNAAIVPNAGYISMEEDDPYEASFTISADELHPLKHTTHRAITFPREMSEHNVARNTAANTQRSEYMDPSLSDDAIKCKFTVIGTPVEAIAQECNGNGNNNDSMQWIFESATDLIKGLGGVHHNSSNPLWIDMICDRNTFINVTEHVRPAIHTLTIEDCLTMDCREKLEIFSEYLFICLKTWHDSEQTTTHSINILIFRTMIITYHVGHSITHNVMNDCRYILSKKFGGNMCPSPAWVGHTIIDNVIDRMMPEVESRVCEVETCEQFVFKLCNQSQNELLHRMQNVRSWMVLYRSRLWPKSTITQKLLNNGLWEKEFLCDVPLPYWRDINDHVARMVDLLELGTHTLESIQNIFVAKVSLEMTQQSNNLASVGGKLASVGAVFLPLTVITGIWGMNCRVPFQFNPDGAAFFDDNLCGFIIVLCVMLFSSVFTWKFVNKFN